MKWVGVWLMSILVWLVVGAFECYVRVSRGEEREQAVREGTGTWGCWVFVQGIFMLGLWLVLHG